MADKSEKIHSFIGDGCDQYLVIAVDRDSAIKKFIKWQDSELPKNAQFSEEGIRDKSNWALERTIHIIE